MNGAANRMPKATKNIAMKAPCKPSMQQPKKKRRFRPGDCCSKRNLSIPNIHRTIDYKSSIATGNI